MTTGAHVESIAVPHQQTYAEGPFPLVLRQSSGHVSVAETLAWFACHRTRLTQQAETLGAVLLRGFFSAASADAFDACVGALKYANFAYHRSLSNAVRVNCTDRVFTANEAPADVTIFLHHEMAQTPIHPSKLVFFCERPADTGGATPICRSDRLLKQLETDAPDFVAACCSKGLRYTNVMPAQADLASGMGRSWQSTLSASTRDEAEKRLSQLKYTWCWLPDGALRVTTPVLPAVRESSSGRRSFFNQLIAASHGWKDRRNDPAKSITYGDGSPLDREGVALAARLAEEFTFDVEWEPGDVAIIDNYLTMHGRRRFTGHRRVLASLVADESDLSQSTKPILP